MAWSFNPFTGNLDIVGGGAVVFEGEVETFADLPETIGDPAVGASFLVRSSTGVWLVNRRQAGIWIRRNNTGVRATDWEYGGDYPVNSVNGQSGNVVLGAGDVGAQWPEVVSSILVTGGDVSIPAGRNRRFKVTSYPGGTITLPAQGNQNGDVVKFNDNVILANVLIRHRVGPPNSLSYFTLATLRAGFNDSYTAVWDGGTWAIDPTDTHTAAAILDSTSAGRTLLTAANAQAQRDALDVFVGVANFANLPTPGVTVSAGGSVYVTNDNGKVWVWNGSAYIEISPNTHTRAGTGNVNVGDTALQSASLSGVSNTGVGASALYNNTSGSYNTAVGSGAAQTATTAAYNTAIGAGALNNGTTGWGNVAFGVNAAFNNTVGTRNTLLGAFSDVDSESRTLCVALGYGAITGPLDGTLSIGRFGAEAMAHLTTSSAPTGATGNYLRIWLNGTEYRIPIQAAT
jgi:hypothetical protein